MTNVLLNIALVDDHQLLSESLSSLLRKFEFVESVSTYKSPKEFIASDTEPEIIISDILMPGMSGIDLLLHCKKQGMKCKVILLSSIIEVQTIRYAIRSGADAYIAKDSSGAELADALLTVYGGGQYIGESLRNSLIRHSITEERFIYNLSPREKEVLNLVCSGRTIKETAYDMGLSVNTVQTYYKSILKKFNLNRTADLIVFAIQNGIYNPQ
jgi:two-component system invasion response regulator UvrY